MVPIGLLLFGVLFMPCCFYPCCWGINRINLAIKPYGWLDVFKIIITFVLVCVAWVFFRADTLSLALDYLGQLTSLKSFSIHFFIKNNAYTLMFLLSVLGVVILSIREFLWILQKRETPYINRYWALFLLIAICFMGSFKNQMDFIYFQF